MNGLPGILLPRYRDALLEYLRLGPDADISSAIGLGCRLSVRNLVQAHNEILTEALLTIDGNTAQREVTWQARLFLVAAMLPKRRTGTGSARVLYLTEEILRLDPLNRQLAASVKALHHEGVARKAVERALHSCNERQRTMGEKSKRQEMAQREVYRKILASHENERKELSRELHDVIAQSLTSINVCLDNLKSQAVRSAEGLDASIVSTQMLVADLVGFVQRFARELRPAMLDDLGLIPALKEMMKDITVRTGVHIHMVVSAAVEDLGMTRRTVFYRVAQEALTNITRHAGASRVEVTIRQLDGRFRMTIHDDGNGFSVSRALLNKRKRLGLICMRERLEMVGGHFNIQSKPGSGTTVSADIPSEVTTERLARPAHVRSRKAKS